MFPVVFHKKKCCSAQSPAYIAVVSNFPIGETYISTVSINKSTKYLFKTYHFKIFSNYSKCVCRNGLEMSGTTVLALQ